jgi:hypothetical protein
MRSMGAACQLPALSTCVALSIGSVMDIALQ